eukprot:g38471.t1
MQVQVIKMANGMLYLLLEGLNIKLRVLMRGKAFDMIYVDFSKAFDNIPHGRLVKKVKNLWDPRQRGLLDPKLAKRQEAEADGGGMFLNVGRVLHSEESNHKLQEDISALIGWAVQWKWNSNTEKCEVMHMGRANK